MGLKFPIGLRSKLNRMLVLDPHGTFWWLRAVALGACIGLLGLPTPIQAASYTVDSSAFGTTQPQPTFALSDLQGVADATNTYALGQLDQSFHNGNFGDPVSTKDGLLYFRATDFSYARPGFDLSFRRYYNPKLQASQQNLGHSWMTDYHKYVFVKDVGGGSKEAYLVIPGQVFKFTKEVGQTNWDKPAGCPLKLENVSSQPNGLVPTNSIIDILKVTDKGRRVTYLAAFQPGQPNIYKPTFEMDSNNNSISYEYENVATTIWQQSTAHYTYGPVKVKVCSPSFGCGYYWATGITGYTLSWDEIHDEVDSRLKRVFTNQNGGWEVSFKYEYAPDTTYTLHPTVASLRYSYTNAWILTSVESSSNAVLLDKINFSYLKQGQVFNLTSVERLRPTLADSQGLPCEYQYDANVEGTVNPVLVYKKDFKKDTANASELGDNGYIASYEYSIGNSGKKTQQVRKIFNGRGQEQYELVVHGTGTHVRADLIKGGVNFRTDFYQNDLLVKRIERSDGQIADEYFTYDSEFRLINSTDANGAQTTYDYDANGNLLRETDSFGKTLTYTYTDDLPVTQLDKLNQASSNTYDSKRNRIRVDQPLGSYKESEFDLRGLIVAETDALGNKTVHEYDARGYRVKTTDPKNDYEESIYDEFGRMVSKRDRLGNIATMEFNSRDQILKKTYPNGAQELFTYDSSNGFLASHTALSGVNTGYSYDLDGNRLVEVKGSHVSRFEFDAWNKLAAYVDAKNSRVEFQRNEFGRTKLIHMSNPAKDVAFSYDLNGNLLTRLSGSKTVAFSYDSLNQVIQIATSENPTGILFTYDANGNRLKMVDESGEKDYVYDALGRRTQYVDAGVLGQPLVKIDYAYDSVGNLIRQQENKTNRVLQFGYDVVGQLVKIDEGVGGVFDIVRDAVGHPIQLSYPNGAIVEQRTYDNMNQLTALVQKDARGSLIWKQEIVRAQSTNATSESTLSSTNRYLYDGDDRLASESDGVSKNTNYTYTETGSRQSETRNGSTKLYTYGPNDELESIDGRAVLSDDMGNLTRYEPDAGYVKNLSWDSLRQLRTASVTKSGSTSSITFKYDGDRRLAQSNDGEKTSRFIYSGDRTSLVLDQNSNVESYSAHPFRWIDEFGNSFLVLYDGRGSVSALADDRGNIVQKFEYDAFGGNLGVASDKLRKRFYASFGALTFDEIGMTYTRNRWYDHSIGSFISRDPSGYSGSRNQYDFCNGNPLSYVDPDGEFWWLVIGIALSAYSAYATAPAGIGGWELAGRVLLGAGLGLVGGEVVGPMAKAFFSIKALALSSFEVGLFTGATVGATTNALSQQVLNGNVNWGRVLTAGAFGGIGGGAASLAPSEAWNFSTKFTIRFVGISVDALSNQETNNAALWNQSMKEQGAIQLEGAQ